jgi:hypothetical protein
MKVCIRVGIGVSGLVLLTVAALGQPRVVNGQWASRPAASGIERELRSLLAARGGPAWAGFSVPLVEGDHRMCCNYDSGCCGGCALEGREGGNTVKASNPGPARLETGNEMFVLFRIENGEFKKIRMFTPDCELDAGGLPFHWFTGVRPPDSIALLSSLAARGEEQAQRQLADSAVAAIAMHRDPEADRALENFVTPGQPESLREHTAFWLGNARGKRGYLALRRMLQDDPSEKVREKVVFALTQSKEPEALETLFQTARTDRSAHVRGQTLFWIAQKAGKKAAAAITEAIENDPETDVKKRAVFALSQLPKDEGVPLLIQVAKTNKNPAVRKQAMFWLGQTGDARALAFFEEVLKK